MSLHLIDSEAWLEFFAGSELAAPLDEVMEKPESILVLPFTLAEVFRSLLQQTTASQALRAIAHMQLGQMIELDDDLSLSAARMGVKNELHLYDCYLLACAKKFEATLWTTNSELERMPNVHVLKSKLDLKSFRLYR